LASELFVTTRRVVNKLIIDGKDPYAGAAETISVRTFKHRRAKASSALMLLKGDDSTTRSQMTAEQLLVDGLRKARVHKPDLNTLFVQ